MAYYTLSVVFLIGVKREEFMIIIIGETMKHVFIINPNAGRKGKLEKFCSEIKECAERLGLEYELYFTKGPKDCGKHVRELCENVAEGEKLRIYGCGGDGTVMSW